MNLFKRGDHIEEEPQISQDADAYLALKETALNIHRLCAASKRQTILITSFHSPDDASSEVAALAFALAQQGKTTGFVVELAQLERWGLECSLDYNQMMESEGLAGAAAGHLPNPFFIGVSDPSDVTLYDGDRAGEFLKWARSTVDILVFFLPGFRASSLPHFLVPQVDGVFLVIDDHTTRRSALAMKEEIQRAGGEALGVIMHRIVSPIPPAILRKWKLI